MIFETTNAYKIKNSITSDKTGYDVIYDVKLGENATAESMTQTAFSEAFRPTAINAY